MRTAVVGVGNLMMKDDGIGPFLISKLEELESFPPNIDLIDEGVGGMRIIHDIEGYDKVLIIDSTDFGGEPGDHRIFKPEEVETVKQISGRSLHEMDLIRTLELARIMGTSPSEIWIMAVQPRSVDMGDILSEELMSRMNEYIQTINDLMALKSHDLLLD